MPTQTRSRKANAVTWYCRTPEELASLIRNTPRPTFTEQYRHVLLRGSKTALRETIRALRLLKTGCHAMDVISGLSSHVRTQVEFHLSEFLTAKAPAEGPADCLSEDDLEDFCHAMAAEVTRSTGINYTGDQIRSQLFCLAPAQAQTSDTRFFKLRSNNYLVKAHITNDLRLQKLIHARPCKAVVEKYPEDVIHFDGYFLYAADKEGPKPPDYQALEMIHPDQVKLPEELLDIVLEGPCPAPRPAGSRDGIPIAPQDAISIPFIWFQNINQLQEYVRRMPVYDRHLRFQDLNYIQSALSQLAPDLHQINGEAYVEIIMTLLRKGAPMQDLMRRGLIQTKVKYDYGPLICRLMQESRWVDLHALFTDEGVRNPHRHRHSRNPLENPGVQLLSIPDAEARRVYAACLSRGWKPDYLNRMLRRWKHLEDFFQTVRQRPTTAGTSQDPPGMPSVLTRF